MQQKERLTRGCALVLTLNMSWSAVLWHRVPGREELCQVYLFSTYTVEELSLSQLIRIMSPGLEKCVA